MSSGSGGPPVEIPEALAASHGKYSGAAGRAWVAALPGMAADYLERWELRRDGPVMWGAVALVFPVVAGDGTEGVLKLQPVNEETAGEPVALEAWNGHGAVRLLRHDPRRGAMLLERLDTGRTLAAVPDDLEALRALSELLATLNAVAAPPGIRRLSDIGGAMLDRVPRALAALPDPDDRRLVRVCAGALADLLPEPGDRLLHWDLHYDNVLAVPAARPPAGHAGPWLAIDPKPLAGDPGFELLAALHNRWADVVATCDVPRAVRVRFDLMTEVVGLDRRRAAGWTLGRVLQNMLWEAENGDTTWCTEPDKAVGRALVGGYWRG